MATKTLMLAAGQDGNYGALVDGVDQTAASRADGWTVAKISSLLAADFDAATKQVSGTFVTNTTRPSVLITSTTANALKTPAALSGVFANTAWTFTFAVRAGTASSQAGRMRLRVFRSVNADGSSATEITGATQVGTTSSALSTSADVTTVVTWTPGAAIQLRNEYLFFAIAWEITTASGSNSGDVLLRTGQASGGSRVVTSDFGATSPVAKTLALSYNVRRIVANSVTVGYAVKFTNNGIMVGSFAAPTSTGNKAITGVGFQPIALLFFADLKTADGASGSSPNFEAPATILGMVTLTDKACIYTTNDDNGGDSAFTTSYPIFNQQSSGTINFSAQLVSMDSDGFTLNFGVVSSPYVINFMAIAGVVSGKTIQAAIKSMASPTATGNTSLTGIGFKPDGAILLGGINGGLTYGFGVADSAGGQASYSANINGSATYGRYQRVNKAYVEINHRTVRYEATLASFDTDGLTLNFTTANQGGTAGTIVALCIKGLQFHVGNFLQKTSVGAQAYTGAGFKPIGAIFGSVGSVAATTIETTRVLEIIGASDGGHQFALLHGDQHVATAALSRALIFHSWSDISATPTKLDASATFNTLDSDGFTLNYPVADATAREVFYLAIGPPSIVPISKSLALSYHVGPLPYSGVILADGPTGYWRMEDSGNTAVDISGSGNDLTDGGGSTPSVPLATGLLVNEPTSKARSFGPVSFVSRGGALYPLNTFSIEMWIKRNTPGALEVVLDQYNGGMQVVFNSDGTFYLGKSFVGSISQTSALKITDTNTHHVVITRNGIGGAVVYYLDGVPETPAQTNPTLDLSAVSGSGLFIGSEWGNYPFTGTLDELAIYPTVLTSTQVSNHYTIGSTPPSLTHVTQTLALNYNVKATVAKSLALTYNVKNQISKSLSTAYNVKKAITQTVTTSYNIKKQIAKAQALSYNVKIVVAKTITPAYNVKKAIVQAISTNYNVKKSITKTSAFNYNVIARITKALALNYNVKKAITQTITTNYNVKKQIVKTVTPAYNVIQRIVKTLSLSYNVASGATSPVLKTSTFNYNVRVVVAKTITPTYNVIGRITKTITPAYNVKKSIAQTSTFSYNVISRVTVKTLTPAYNVRRIVAKTVTPVYNVKKQITKTVAPAYNIVGRITKTVTPTYNIVQRIVKTQTFNYNILSLGAVSKQFAINYNVRKQIVASLTSTYFVRRTVTATTLTTSYTVRKTIVKTVAPAYNVKQQIIKALSPSYFVRRLVIKTVTPAYNVKQQIVKTSIFNYNIVSLSGVSKSLVLSYNVRKLVATTLSTSYFVKRAIVKTLIPTYNVKQRITGSATFSYNVKKQIAKTSTFSYNVTKANVTKTLTASYLIRVRITKTVVPTYLIRKFVAKPVTVNYIIRRGLVKPLTLSFLVRQQITKTLPLIYSIGSAAITPIGTLTITQPAMGYGVTNVTKDITTITEPALGYTATNEIKAYTTISGGVT